MNTDHTSKGFLHSALFTDIAFSILLWAVLVIRFGFTLGTGDQTELLPYVKYLANPSLYHGDFFITHLHASLPNERTVFAHLLLPFVNHFGSTIFLLHLLNSVLLIWGLVRLGRQLLGHRYLAYTATIIAILLLNDKGLGDVDVYSPALQASDVSCMLIAWALGAFFSERWVLTTILMTIATYIHVLEGFDVMVVMSGVMIWRYFAVKDISMRTLLAFCGTYLLVAGAYIVPLYMAKTAGAADLSNREYFWIMFEFRHPHHFIFRTFSHSHKLLFMLYTAASLLYFPTHQRKVARFIFIAIGGIVVYITAVDFLHISAIANLQWYKVVEWTKFLGIVAIVGLIYDKVKQYLLIETWIPAMNYTLVTLAGISLGYMMSLYCAGRFAQDFHRGTDAEIAFCREAAHSLPADALVIQPFGMTALKYYAERSSYIDFKAVPKNRRDVNAWYSRISEVYGLDYLHIHDGFHMQDEADAYMNQLSRVQLDSLHAEGVTHAIFNVARPDLQASMVMKDHGYYLYKL